jgi:hypothetical protein
MLGGGPPVQEQGAGECADRHGGQHGAHDVGGNPRSLEPTACSGEVGDRVGVAGAVELVVERDVDGEGHGEDEGVEHEGGDDPAGGDVGAVTSLPHGGERSQHQRPGEAEEEHRVLDGPVDALHRVDEGAVVDLCQTGHHRHREGIEQTGDQRHRDQRRAEHQPGPPVLESVASGPGRPCDLRAETELGHRSAWAGGVHTPVAAVCAA